MLSGRPGPSIPSQRRSIGRNYDEGVAGGWSSLRPPDATLEPEDEGVHFRGTQRHPHYRPAENPQDVPRSLAESQRVHITRPRCAVSGHEAPGAGSHRRRSEAMRDVFRESPLARRDADELGDAAEIHQAAEDDQSHGGGRAREHAAEERSGAAGPRVEAFEAEFRRR